MKPEDFGLSKAEADKVKDITPSFDLGELKFNESVTFKILDNETKEVKYKDDKGKEQSRQVLRVLNIEDNLECTLWLSSKSLKMEFYKLASKLNGNIKNVTVKITPRQYTHKEFGKTKAYVVREVISHLSD